MMSLNDSLLESSSSILSFDSKNTSEALFVPNGLLGDSSSNLLQQLEEAAAQRSPVVEGKLLLGFIEPFLPLTLFEKVQTCHSLKTGF
jgi:hypothetical protein